MPEPTNPPSLTSEEHVSSEINFKQQSEQLVHQVVRPTAISFKSHTQPSNDHKEIINVVQKVATWAPFTGKAKCFECRLKSMYSRSSLKKKS